MIKRYTDITQSNINWLGEYPCHWRITRYKDVSEVTYGFPFDSKKFSSESGEPLVRIRDIIKGQTDLRYQGQIPSEAWIKDTDILVGMDGDFNTVWWQGGDAILNQRVACVRTSNLTLQRFLFYTLPLNLKVINDVTFFTTVKHLSGDDIKRNLFALPPESEVVDIVNYLDFHTKKIDSLITEKQRFITLLKEKRQALISHVVTKGLDANVKMKDSGVEWIGEVPEHWEVIPLKYLCNLQTGDKDTVMAVPSGQYDFFVRAQEALKIDVYTHDCEAVLTAGDGAGVGKVYFYTNGKFSFHQRVYMMNNFKKILGKYFYLYLSSLFASVALDGAAKSTVDSLRMPVFKNFTFTVPPKEEQEEILNKLNTELGLIDELISETEKSVSLLKEKRSALISAAVTGKIDVRGFNNKEAS